MSDVLIDLDTEVEDTELESILTVEDNSSGSLEYVPDSPYWAVSRNEFIRALRVVNTLPAKSMVFLAIKRDGDKLRIHANNKDAIIDIAIPFTNAEPHDTTKEYFLDLKILSQFVGNYSDFVFTFDESDKIYFENTYVKYQLECLTLTLQQVGMEPHIPTQASDWSRYPLTKAQTSIFKSLFGFAASLNDNKVFFTQDRVKASLTLYQFSVSNVIGNPKPTYVRRVDIPTLSEICSGGDVEMAVTDERVHFRFDLGEVSFLRYPGDEDNSPETLAMGDEIGTFDLDVKMFRRALKLSTVLQIPQVDFVCENESIFVLAGTKARFAIGHGTLSEDFTLNTELLVKLISTIDVNEVFVKCRVTQSGIEIQINRDTPHLYSLSRTTVGQLRRKEKIDNKIENRQTRIANMKESGRFNENLADSGRELDDILAEL